MYDEIVNSIELTCDETEVLLELLNARKDTCVGLSERITLDNLIDKIQSK